MRFHFDENGNPIPGNLCSFIASAAALSAASATAASAGIAASAGAAVGSFGAIASTSAAVGLSGASFLGTGLSLSSAFSVFSGISSLAQGIIQGRQLDAQSELENLRARGELLEGQRQIIESKEQFIIDLASFNARAGGSGIAPTEGSALAAKRAAQEDLDFQTDITRTSAAIKSGVRRSNASVLKSRAGGARFSGISNAIASGFKVADRLKRRGSIG